MPRAKYHVVVTDDASADLLDIGLYIAEESPAAALRLVNRLRRAAAELSDRAMRYALVPSHEDSDVRRRVVGSYNIFYHVTDDRVEVLHFLHHARDHEQLVFPED
jgi:toxin ParE1/3/4